LAVRRHHGNGNGAHQSAVRHTVAWAFLTIAFQFACKDLWGTQRIVIKKECAMYVWSKRLVIGLLAVFVLVLTVFLTQDQLDGRTALKVHTTWWITLNYVGLVLWVFVWMIDQTRMRGKNVGGVSCHDVNDKNPAGNLTPRNAFRGLLELLKYWKGQNSNSLTRLHFSTLAAAWMFLHEGDS